MEIKTEFNVGDKVYFIENYVEQKECDVCEGVGSVNIKGQLLSCPKCMGNKCVVSDTTIRQRPSEKPKTIRSIRINIANRLCNKKYKVLGVLDVLIDYILPGGMELSLPGDKVFATFKEAQEYCDCNYINKKES